MATIDSSGHCKLPQENTSQLQIILSIISKVTDNWNLNYVCDTLHLVYGFLPIPTHSNCTIFLQSQPLNHFHQKIISRLLVMTIQYIVPILAISQHHKLIPNTNSDHKRANVGGLYGTYLVWKFKVLMQRANIRANKTVKPTKTAATGPMKSGWYP